MNTQNGFDSQMLEARPKRQKGQYAWIVGLLVGLAIAFPPGMDVAYGIDTYPGDTAIYQTPPIQPNVLIILDSSGSMHQKVPSGPPYDPATIYTLTKKCDGNKDCKSNNVYICSIATVSAAQCSNWINVVSNVSSVATTCPAPPDNPYQSLTTSGMWNSTVHGLNNAGTCTSGSGVYAVGNWINWWQVAKNTTDEKWIIAKRVVTNFINNTRGVRFGVMVFGLNAAAGGSLMNYAGYTAEIKDMDALFLPGKTNRQALIEAVNAQATQGSTTLAESLFETMRYYQGGPTAFPVNNGSITYTSPIQADCQKNYVVIVTDGMSNKDNDPVLRSICKTSEGYLYDGDCTRDGPEKIYNIPAASIDEGTDFLKEVAKYLHDTDLSTAFSGVQSVITHTIGFGLAGAVDSVGAVPLLQDTAKYGGGKYFDTNDEQDLTQALTQILVQIIEANTAFVAPVVPLSPDNKSYSGSRVYLGFFKPQQGAFWYGNLKKYGLDPATGAVLDKDGLPATNSDGTFLATSTSYWSTAADGGEVDRGGVGGVLLNRDFTTNPRDIYTYTGTKTKLTRPRNAFTTINPKIIPSDLGVNSIPEKDDLINFIHGRDAYDVNKNGITLEKRGWILGDILHSRPQVVSYASYTFTPTAEADCNVNKTMIYVGANDGMLHVFRDCDGSEAWAFIPEDLLPNLKYLTQSAHTYFVDSSPSVYIYDANKDGNIKTIDGDKVILIFGERRGGGSYFALDVSDPYTPRYLWDLSSTYSPSGVITDYSELGQSWSEPEITKVKLGSGAKVVAIIGAGYDNANEDGRYGATQTFNGTGTTSGNGEGVVTSSGTSAPLNPKGRGVYVVEVASLDSSGVPSFTNSGSKVWGYTNANNGALVFSIPSAVTVLGRNNNVYADRVYVGDTGGSMWRLDIGDSSTSNWTGRKIFSSNPGSGGSADVGRKIFYKPSVILEAGYEMMFFGTGDREHPLNRAVVDRLYALKDKSESGVMVVEKNVDNLHELVDVTTNALQGATPSPGQITAILSDLNTKYGWYIRLNQNSGEKVLAPAIAFTEVYYTTYAPVTTGVADPCSPANQMTARVYIVGNKTGEAVHNLDKSNDLTSTSNTRAKNAAGKVLMASDRVMALGAGIPSGVVLALTAGGQVIALVGCGGSLCAPPPPSSPINFPIYWKRMR